MIKQFISYCKKHKYQFQKGYDWCDCNPFGDFVNVIVKGKTHTLYAYHDGSFVFDKSKVETIEEIENLLNAD